MVSRTNISDPREKGEPFVPVDLGQPSGYGEDVRQDFLPVKPHGYAGEEIAFVLDEGEKIDNDDCDSCDNFPGGES